MGAAQSTEPRSVSMDNPSPSGVIDVSDDVVQRLKKGISRQAKEKYAAASASPPVAPKQEARSVPIKQTPAPSPVPAPAPTVIYQAPPTMYVAPGGTTITAADVMRQKEAELLQNDAMWRQRMAELEQTLKKTNVIMESEYSLAVEDVRQRFATAASTQQLPPCQDLKAQLIACYRQHPGETLKCADAVAAFQNCVSVHRIQKLDLEEEQKPAAGAAVKSAAAKGA